VSVVGIDLGTTNTVVACVRGGKVHVLADEQGQRLLPSVVSFHPNGQVLVGSAARARRIIDPRNTIYSHKRLIGRSWGSPEIARAKQRCTFELREGPGQAPLVRARNQDYTLPEISAFVLRRVRQIAELALGEPAERAVITVPAHFNELQRASTKVAGRVAGLDVLRILNEPTAAALAYGLGRTGNERVAVYDFGGGTFDCTLLDLNGNVFEVLASAGDTFLGGDDIDMAIAERMTEALLREHRVDARTDPQLFERLKTSAEEVKIALSRTDKYAITLKDIGHGVGGGALQFTFTLARRDLESMIQPLVDRTFKVTEDALAIARLTPTSFDKVILVGGSTRIPMVRRRVEAFFGAPPLDRVNPEEVVAIGASIQAAALTGSSRRRRIPDPPPRPSTATSDTLPAVRGAAPPVWSPQQQDDLPSGQFGDIGDLSLASTTGVSVAESTSPSMTAGRPTEPSVSDFGRISELSLISMADADLLPAKFEDDKFDNLPQAREDNLPQAREGGLQRSHTMRPSSPPPEFARGTMPLPQTPATPAPASRGTAPMPPPRTTLPIPGAVSVPFNPKSTAPMPTRSVPPHPQGTVGPAPADLSPITVPSPEPLMPARNLGVTPPILIDVTPRALVVETAGGYTDTIIPRNAKIPCERTRRFATGRDMQTSVRVRVAQGEHPGFQQNTYLGELELSGLRPAPRGGVVIAVTFEVDADGTLRVRARDVQTGVEARATLQLVGVADESSVVMMINRLSKEPAAGGQTG